MNVLTTHDSNSVHQMHTVIWPVTEALSLNKPKGHLTEESMKKIHPRVNTNEYALHRTVQSP